MSDAINPSHYKHLPVEAIDIIDAAIEGAPSPQAAAAQSHLLGYALRANQKGQLATDAGKTEWYAARWLKAIREAATKASGANEPPSEPPKPSRTQPPSGYRMLGDAKSEPRIEGDSYWSVGAKGWFPLVEELVRFANHDNWPACRKIEKPSNNPTASLNSDKIPEGYRKLGDSKSEPRRSDDLYWSDSHKHWTPIGFQMSYANRDNWAACRKIEEPLKRYREPTLADLANGPIECEVRQGNLDAWDKRTLIYVFSEYGFPFVCVWASQGSISRWSQCRIEVQE